MGEKTLFNEATRLTLRKGQILYNQDDPADGWIELRSGALRLCHYYSDGRRQVLAFPVAGDVFGLEAGFRLSSAEALVECTVVKHRHRGDWSRFSPRPTPAPASHPLERGLALVQDSLQFFGYPTAAGRLGAFLIEFARRQGQGDRVDLPMSRLDIAEHLGLTMHTISRAFAQLARSGLIECVTPQRIRFPARSELVRASGFEAMALSDLRIGAA